MTNILSQSSINLINTLNPDLSEHLKEAWEKDLSTPISDDNWSHILNQVHSSSICARHGLILYEVLYRANLTNAQIFLRQE